MTTKTKKIQKQGKVNSSISVKKASQLRNYFRKKLVSPKYADTWLQVLQSHKKQTVHQSNSFKQTVKQYKDFTCPICFDLMIFPVTLTCRHTFCRPCIEQATLLHDQCSICRKKNELQYFTVSNKINDIILTIGLSFLSNQQKRQYWERYNEYTCWQRMNMIDPEFRIGELIHFYDYDYKKQYQKGWRYGVITKVIVKQNKDAYLTVQPLYFRQSQQLGQKFSFHYLSSRLAKYQFFYDAKKFKETFQKDTNQDKIKNRDQQLIQTIKRRIEDKSIRQRYEHRKLSFHELFNRNKNAIKFLPTQEKFKSIQEVYNYTFCQFQQGAFLTRDFEFSHIYQIFSSWSSFSSGPSIESE